MVNYIKRHNWVLAIAVAGAVQGVAFGDPVAFPGADGFGANALGGRGGFVYHVTNLTDDATTPAPGSLRYGLIAKNWPAGATAETIVFDVGGTIQLTDTLDVKGISNVTIAGQTAPGPGITLVNYKLQVTSSTGTKANAITSNIVIRYLTSLHGNATGADDSVGVLGSTSNPTANTHDIIMDHITAAWGNDENMSVTNDANNVTISNSFITEPIEKSHEYGSLIRARIDNANVSYIGNLYANSKSRNPRPGSYNGDTLNFDFRNNVVYNYSDRAGYTGGDGSAIENVNMNYVGNYIIAGPATPTGAVARTAFTADNSGDGVNVKIYQLGNKVDSNGAGQTTTGNLTGAQGVDAVRDGVDTGWGMFAEINTSGVTVPLDDAFKQATPFDFPTLHTDDADTAYQKVLASAGALPWNRSTSDARVVNDVKTSTGTLLTGVVQSEWDALISQAPVVRAAGFDTDQDGMADAWERARGLNPLVASNNLVVTAAESSQMAGYTWLEMYLNDLAMQAVWAGGTSGEWDTILNWNGQLPNLQDSTAVFGNVGATAHVTVSSMEHVGQLSLDNPAGYTFTGSGGITMDVMNKSGGTGGFATITVASGGQVIAVPLTLASDTHFTIAGGSSLNVTGALLAGSAQITKDGQGVVQFTNVRAAGLAIGQGAVVISRKSSMNDGSGTSVVKSLSITSGGQLDVTNNSFIIDYTGAVGTMVDDTRQLILSGGIMSSAADAQYRLGYADNGVLGLQTFGSQQVDSSSLLIQLVLGGDTNLDGHVNMADLQALAMHWHQSGVWTGGDLTYDGYVDQGDLDVMRGNWQGPGSFDDAVSQVGLTQVPEPAMGLPVAGAAAMLLARRRRR